MSETGSRTVCGETYYPMWSSRGIRGVKCQRPAKFTTADGLLFCGVHARRYARWNAKGPLAALQPAEASDD